MTMVKSNLYHAGTAAFLAAFAIISVGADQPLTSTELPDGTGAALASEASFRFPADLTVKLFAAEPQLMNPVAISVDPKGQVFVAEEYRFNRGTEENRTRPFLLEDDLQISNLEDRYAAFEKYQDRFEGGMEWFTRYTDQVRMLSDSDGDGRADVSRVFAAGFNQPLEGLLAGVLAHEGDVFVANIPNLWRLRDTDADGVADDRQILLSGFGINAGFLGHDLHGLVVGPDGKLYFSVGDRGFHVIDREGVAHSLPRRGAVFRCNLDGSQFEVLHIGLRNPQELAFDEYGNLLAADNNCDKGDYSRLVLIVPGGDSGWNMAFQSIPEPYQTGPWMAEAMWHLESEKQSQDLRPAWVLPPIGKLGAGPSGFAYCGAAGWSQDYRGRFYMCNYTGNGGIESFALEPNGASLRMVDERDLIKPIQATDCDFGFDGRLYISDFVGLEWNGGSKGGRIYVLSPKTTMESPAIQDASIKSPPVHNLGQATDSSEVSTGTWFIQQSIDTWDINQLVPWLKHSDYRVRQRAQFAIAKHGAAGIDAMKRIANDSGSDPRVRLHGVWGLGQLLPDDSAVEALLLTSRDADPWIRSNTAKLLANRDFSDEAALRVESRLMELLQDSDARVSMQAAFSAGCLRMRQSIPSLFSLAKSNQGHDKYLRHSIVHALTQIGDREAVQARSGDTDREIRMICLLTMRHSHDPTIGDFLNDSDWWLVTEAARAIHDIRIESQQPLLANLTNRPDIALAPEPLLRRIIGANYLLGTTDALQHVIDLSCDPGLPTKIRQEAFLAIESWHLPSSRDRVTGDWRPSNPRNMDTIRPVLANSLPALLGAAENTLAELMSIVDRYDLPLQSAQLEAWLKNEQLPAPARTTALRWLIEHQSGESKSYLDLALQSKDPGLRAYARTLVFQADPAIAQSLFGELLEPGGSIPEAYAAQSNAAAVDTTIERQSAISALANSNSEDAERLLMKVVQQATGHQDDCVDIQLELLQSAVAPAAENRSEAYRSMVAILSSSITNKSSLGRFQPSLWGGDAQRGKAIFLGNQRAQCIRCHRIGDQGGDAGPNLTAIGTRTLEAITRGTATDPQPKSLYELADATRQYLAYAVVEPDRHIATGYATVSVITSDGITVSGSVSREDGETLELIDGRKTTHVIRIDDIEARRNSTSAMPPMGEILEPRDVRDVVEFLMTDPK